MKYIVPLFLTPLLSLLVATSAQAAIQTEVIEYRHGDQVLEGYLAYDDDLETPQPGVMVVHAWKGLGEYEKRRTRELAELGYVAFAADIYGKGIRPETNAAASELASYYRSNRGLLRDRAQAGLEVLRDHPLSLPDQLAAIGYCFGGGTVLELARSGAEVLGVVSFHGNLDTPNPAEAQNIQGQVLALHGADDPFVPPEDVDAFITEMQEADVDWQLVLYGEAVHSFTDPNAGNDPSQGSAYNAEADQRSWAAMRQFFQDLFF
ncbi:dienelactone hydrolase family protein [Spirulina sp. CS-785/01]|uniref:dienelactone hydrolase family protein n=1 Tax=Spirulina sp. CS-785/01 TaxID=3021716 RepID=UPI00232C33CB|nr:dienelactone hydrolase family protein [Spirulina sp. CS-785/01]MDB9313600.1 dienelactone hydrolase family protein [Spirulina sp. CS-785/01]